MVEDTRAARRERQQRLNRLLLVGTAGSLAFFLGIIATQDAVTTDPPTSIAVEQVQQELPAIRAPQPRVRTRTS